jgi:hypothetical protein
MEMNKENIQYVLEHVTPRVQQMKLGGVSDCEGLFDLELWNAVPSEERRYVFGHQIALLVAQGKLPLRFVGFDRAHHNLYEKI